STTCRSVRQMPHAWTRRRISPGAGCGSGSSRSVSGWLSMGFGLERTIARTAIVCLADASDLCEARSPDVVARDAARFRLGQPLVLGEFHRDCVRVSAGVEDDALLLGKFFVDIRVDSEKAAERRDRSDLAPAEAVGEFGFICQLHPARAHFVPQ